MALRALTGGSVFVTSARIAMAQKAAADLDDPNPVDSEHVYQQLLENYKPAGIEWVRQIPWIGPIEVPLDRIDWDDVSSWAASHQKKRVKHFARQVRDNADDVKPVVGVRVPGDDRLKVIDGHHRALAYQKEGKPVKAYVGMAPSDKPGDPWFQAHSFQDHNGSDAANKSEASDWEPVSFAKKTASGKVIVRVADLLKVGKEGYIHGFICVRPPCGQYKEALHNTKNGQVVHGDTGAKIGQQLKKEAGHQGYTIQHIKDGKKGAVLNGQYATRADAAKVLAVYHNLDVLHGESGSGTTHGAFLDQAKKQLAAGDHQNAMASLVSAELAANQAGDKKLSEHITDLRAALNEGPKPGIAHPPEKAPAVPEPAKPNALAAYKDLSEFSSGFTPSSPGYKNLQAAKAAAGKANYASAATHLSAVHTALSKAGMHDDAATAKDLSGRYKYLQQLPASHFNVPPVDKPKAPPTPAVPVPSPSEKKLSEFDAGIFSDAIGVVQNKVKNPGLYLELQDARDHLDSGDHAAALDSLKVSHSIAQVSGDPGIATPIRNIHNNIAAQLGLPQIIVKPGEPKPPPAPKVKPKAPDLAVHEWEKGLLDEPVKPEPGGAIPAHHASNLADITNATGNLTATQKLDHTTQLLKLKNDANDKWDNVGAIQIEDAKSKLATGDYENSLALLQEAHAEATLYGYDGLATDIISAHNSLVKDLTPATPVVPTAPAAKKLSKAKQAQFDKRLTDVNTRIWNESTGSTNSKNEVARHIIAARSALASNDIPKSLSAIQSAHAMGDEAGIPESLKNSLAQIHDDLSTHTGTKPLQPRTVTRAAGLASGVSSSLKELDALGMTKYLHSPDLASEAHIASRLKAGQAADVVRELRASNENLKSNSKYSWGGMAAKYAAAQANVKKALASLEKVHNQDLAEKTFDERAAELKSAILKNSHGINATRLQNAVDYQHAGNTPQAQATLRGLQKSMSKSFSTDMSKAIAVDVKNLHNSLNAKPEELPPGAKLPDAHGGFSTSRQGDIGAAAAEHFFATGSAGSTQKVSDPHGQGPAYKQMATHAIADEMKDVSLQDLARVAQHNWSYNRLNQAVVEAIAKNGVGAVRVNRAVVGSDPKKRYTTESSSDHAKAVDEAIKALSENSSMARYRVAQLKDTELSDNGMPFSTREKLLAFSSGHKELVRSKNTGNILTAISYTPTSHEQLSDKEKADYIHQLLVDHRKNLSANGTVTASEERELKAELVGSLVSLWASSSNDDHIASLSTQKAVADELGLKGSLPWKSHDSNLNAKVDAFYAEHGPTLRRFARAQYDLTQRELASAGIKSVTLHRGMRWSSPSEVPTWAKTGSMIKSPGSVVVTKSSDWRPISSWSHSSAEASSFYASSGKGMQVKASVPASLIFSTPRTGNGCLHEKEWVVLGGDGQLNVSKSRS